MYQMKSDRIKQKQITLEFMREMGLVDMLLRLTNSGVNYQVKDHTTLTRLLPVKYIMWTFTGSGFYDFKNPKTEEEMVETWESEEERRIACEKINAEIMNYNKWVEEEKSKIPDIEDRVTFKYYPVGEYEKWNIGAWMEIPVHKRHDLQSGFPREQQFINSTSFNNEFIFNQLIGMEEMEGILRFNKMIHDYITVMTDGKTLTKDSTLYYPKLEFEDYWMRMGIDPNEVTSLLESPKSIDPKKKIFLGVGDWTLEDWGTSLNPDTKLPTSKAEDWTLKIDMKKSRMEFSHNTIKELKTGGEFLKYGFRNYKGNANTLVQLLWRYGLFHQGVEQDNFILNLDIWTKMIQSEFKFQTIQKYQRALTSQLKSLLHIEDKLFAKVPIYTEPSADTKGKVEKDEIGAYYNCLMNIEIIDEVKKEVRGLGMYEDSFEDARKDDPLDDFVDYDDDGTEY